MLPIKQDLGRNVLRARNTNPTYGIVIQVEHGPIFGRHGSGVGFMIHFLRRRAAEYFVLERGDEARGLREEVGENGLLFSTRINFLFLHPGSSCFH